MLFLFLMNMFGISLKIVSKLSFHLCPVHSGNETELNIHNILGSFGPFLFRIRVKIIVFTQHVLFQSLCINP